MAGELLAGMAAFKGLTDIVSTLSKMKSETERAAAVFDVTQKLIAIQQQYLLLAGSHQELSDENARLKRWADEKDKYELFSPSTGTYAYRAKEAERGTQPDHCLCANCYENGKKSILQTVRIDIGRVEMLTCSACKTDVIVKGSRPDARFRPV